MDQVIKKEFSSDVISALKKIKPKMKKDNGEYLKGTILDEYPYNTEFSGDMSEEEMQQIDEANTFGEVNETSNELNSDQKKMVTEFKNQNDNFSWENGERVYNDNKDYNSIAYDRKPVYHKSWVIDDTKYSNRFDMMLKKNSKNFHYHYSNRDFLNKDECAQLIEDFESGIFSEHLEQVDAFHEIEKPTFEGSEVKKDSWRICDIRWLRFYQKNYEWLFERLDKKIKEINK